MTNHYSRHELAKRYVSQFLSNQGLTTTSVLVAAPRRTGKTTFVRKDLIPALEKEGAVVIYADLWSDQQQDPAQVIARAVLKKLHEMQATPKWLRGVESVELTIAGVGLSASNALTKDITFTDALAELSDKTSKKIVLIVDEFQHALTTEKGKSALFALKAARDEVNSGDHFGMVLLGTGSNQDKLAAMRNSKEQAFYLTPLIELPRLDQNFTNWLCDISSLPLDRADVWELFQKSGHKPEIVSDVIKNLSLSFLANKNMKEDFREKITETLDREKNIQQEKINSLPTVQWSVLAFMAMKEKDIFLQSQAACVKCEDLSQKRGEKVKMTISSIQSALSALKKKKIIWMEDRGVYHIEDEAIASLIKNQVLDLTNTGLVPSNVPKRKNRRS